MSACASKAPPDPKTAVLAALARLRAAFPLEERLRTAPVAVRAAYAEVLRHWLRAAPPATTIIDAGTRAALLALDAVVEEPGGLGCYPFSARDTGIRATLPSGTVHAMCAIDALAIARLARARTDIAAACAACEATVNIRVEDNGGLGHDQADRARVVWTQQCGDGSCSQNLCRGIRFLCNDCTPPADSDCYSLPQAAAIGNAFFSFQPALLHAHDAIRA